MIAAAILPIQLRIKRAPLKGVCVISLNKKTQISKSSVGKEPPMKKTAVIIAAIAALMLTGCGSGGGTSGTADQSGTEASSESSSSSESESSSEGGGSENGGNGEEGSVTGDVDGDGIIEDIVTDAEDLVDDVVTDAGDIVDDILPGDADGDENSNGGSNGDNNGGT